MTGAIPPRFASSSLAAVLLTALVGCGGEPPAPGGGDAAADARRDAPDGAPAPVDAAPEGGGADAGGEPGDGGLDGSPDGGGGEPGAFRPPAGIPAPEFGIEEQLEDFYRRPEPWDEETPGWYFVQRDHPEASDGRTYGTPSAPRATIPDPVPAGSVVVLAGTYDYAPAGYDRIEAEGTAEAPVFIISEPGAVVTRKWVVASTYLIVDGLEFTDRGKVAIVYPSHHVAFRNGEHHHIAGKFGGYGDSDAERVHDVVIYRNRIHSQDGWDANPEVDLDNHAIKFGAWVERVWVLDNVGYHNGGNFIQIGDYNSPADLTRARFYYIGRNELYANRQSPIGIKQASDVIVSENDLHDNRGVQRNAAGQSGVIFQYGPERVWILFNRIYASNAGVTAGSNSGGTGREQFIVGNVIYDIDVPPGYDYNPNTAWAPAAIMLAGGNERYVVDNTIFGAVGGIHCPGGGSLTLHGNVVADIRLGRHVFVEDGATARASSMRRSVLFQPGGAVRIRWGSGRDVALADFEADHPGSENLEADPLLRDPASGDLRPGAGSPLLDSSTEHDVYRRFFELYGIDIRRDVDGRPRPQGAAWDRGAHEADAG